MSTHGLSTDAPQPGMYGLSSTLTWLAYPRRWRDGSG
eukprot:CAMPEP_0177687374 /NCGR_PEP_ID=MMETSP0447-20121125/34089_1 /TAXON_ID=0 /ORGANISM="Stygamoeba regulata, Strain BSH-02190019" /LENGTH=36 /DNA_ID= /DNA_START= /DNA_END= /DNA_ORIENTATION=